MQQLTLQFNKYTINTSLELPRSELDAWIWFHCTLNGQVVLQVFLGKKQTLLNNSSWCPILIPIYWHTNHLWALYTMCYTINILPLLCNGSLGTLWDTFYSGRSSTSHEPPPQKKMKRSFERRKLALFPWPRIIILWVFSAEKSQNGKRNPRIEVWF